MTAPQWPPMVALPALCTECLQTVVAALYAREARLRDTASALDELHAWTLACEDLLNVRSPGQVHKARAILDALRAEGVQW